MPDFDERPDIERIQLITGLLGSTIVLTALASRSKQNTCNRQRREGGSHLLERAAPVAAGTVSTVVSAVFNLAVPLVSR